MLRLVLACLLWGPSFHLVPMMIRDYGIDPYGLAFFRMTTALLLFAALLRPTPLKRSAALMALGAVQYGLMYLTLFLSYRFMAGYEVLLVTIFTPFYVAGFDALTRRTPLQPRVGLAVGLAVAGAGIIRFARVDPDGSFWIGFGIMQLCNGCFAIGQVLYARHVSTAGSKAPLHEFGWMYLGAALITLLGWGLFGELTSTTSALLTLPVKGWLILLWLGLVPSGAAFYLFNRGAKEVSVGTLAVMNNLKIPIGLVVVLILFQQADQITSWPGFLAGSALMLGALWIPRVRV
jgi:drug/metabolite transporter (DMT)-like permease